jgi:quercetin dioxygenase-like cupin family protein
MRLNIAEFPPESVKASPDFDPVAAEAELRENVPGYGDHFEDVVEDPGEVIGYHATPTVDFGFVMRGPLWLDLGDDEMVRLETGDVVVQQGTNHAWRNLGTESARIGFVLIGARSQ